MRTHSKLRALLAGALLLLSLAACESSSQSQGEAALAKDGYTVGICQLVQHDAHDSATRGFMDAVNAALPGQVTFENKVASNDISMCSGIVSQFIAEDVDLILANATPALQIASAATSEIPILGTSVTEYGAALGLEDFHGTVGGNISGTSDLASLDQQAQMVAAWFPEAQTIGMLYCSAEANSRYQVDMVQEYLERAGYTCRDCSFTDSNDLPLVLESAIAGCDVLYVPTDNTVASNTTIIDSHCRYAAIPVIGGDEGICRGCSVATLSISYYDLGVLTGEMAVQILTGEAEISELPIAYAGYTGVYNPALCAELGLTPPSDAYRPLTDG